MDFVDQSESMGWRKSMRQDAELEEWSFEKMNLKNEVENKVLKSLKRKF